MHTTTLLASSSSMHIMRTRVIILKLYKSTYFHSEATRLRQGYPVGVLIVRGVRARTMHSIYIYILCILYRSTKHIDGGFDNFWS